MVGVAERILHVDIMVIFTVPSNFLHSTTNSNVIKIAINYKM